jgi:hypothetical protein
MGVTKNGSDGMLTVLWKVFDSLELTGGAVDLEIHGFTYQ